jgi:hypothetical protein
MAPQRIQRQRRKGWRKPEGAVIVDRTSRYGNPYRVGVDAEDNTEAVALFAAHLADRPDLIEDIRHDLAGRDLVCFCPPDKPCHADLLLTIANQPKDDQ